MAVRRKRRISAPVIDTQDEYHALIATWMLRMLLGSAAAFRGFFDVRRGFHDSDVSDFLGFQDVDDDKIKERELKAMMRAKLGQFEKSASVSSTLFRNIAMMAMRAALTPLHQRGAGLYRTQVAL